MNFREKKKLITRGRMRYLELTEFPLIPRDGLQKEAELSSSPEAQGLLYDRRLRKYRF